MNITRALDGFLFTLKADGYSPATVDLYRIMLSTLVGFLNDQEVVEITPADLTRYFAYLRSVYIPRRQSGNNAPLAGSTLQNHWKAIRRFFRWAEEELGLKTGPGIRLKLPPNIPRAIMPLSEDEVKTLNDAPANLPSLRPAPAIPAAAAPSARSFTGRLPRHAG
jgi:site-specific recombinase XerD